MKKIISDVIKRKHFLHGLKLLAYIVLFAGSAGLFSFQYADDIRKEYELKAVFIYNFIQYIDWPASPSNEYIIGIIGGSPIEEQLIKIAQNKTANNKKITVRHFNNTDEISNCNILFIPRDAPFPLENILAKAPRGTLTISERPGYARKGAAINFVIVDNKLKFESNIKALNSAGLKASSQLLKLAIVVDKNENE